MAIDNSKQAISKIKSSLSKFDPDFDSAADFMKQVIHAVYPKKKSSHAAKILRELDECM